MVRIIRVDSCPLVVNSIFGELRGDWWPAEVVDTRGGFLHRRRTAPDEALFAVAWNDCKRPMKRPEIISALKELLRAQKQVKVDLDALGELIDGAGSRS